MQEKGTEFLRAFSRTRTAPSTSAGPFSVAPTLIVSLLHTLMKPAPTNLNADRAKLLIAAI